MYALGRSRQKLEKRFSEYVGDCLFAIIEQDICSPLSDENHFDYILHGASNADPVSYSMYPVETMTTNLLGSYNILEYGKRTRGCKVLLMSTFEVYGNNGKDVYSESDTGIIDFNAIRACYPESKRSVEILSRCYFNEYDVDVRIVRLSSVYGPTMAKNDSKAHAQFLKNAIEGRDIILKSKGLQERTYTYVVDAVTGILCVLFNGVEGEAYNVSNDISICSIAELANICAKLANTTVTFQLPSSIESAGFSKSQNCILDNKKLKDLGWNGKYDVEEGMKECYWILKQNRDSEIIE